MGPSPTPPGTVWIPNTLAQGVKTIISKGSRSLEVKQAEIITYPELGAEASTAWE